MVQPPEKKFLCSLWQDHSKAGRVPAAHKADGCVLKKAAAHAEPTVSWQEVKLMQRNTHRACDPWGTHAGTLCS